VENGGAGDLRVPDGHALTAISSIALVLHSFHGHLIIFDFSV